MDYLSYMTRSGKSLILFFLIFFCLLSFQSNAERVYGQITDENNTALPYVIVYISGTSNGTTANGDGFYSLDLPKGNYNISFRMIGYTLLEKKVVIDNFPVKMDIQLISETVKLKEVTIRADAEDPAYAIIRAAQKKRKYYRDQVKLYSSNAYVKSTQKLNSYPKKIFGQKVDISETIDSATKIFYLSESVSELFYQAPDKYKEKMISSKVSGSPKTYSFNKATNVLVSFYENLVDISNLTPRGILSPIAGNSFFYYKFILDGTFMENGVMVNKISVIPKRNTDPVFRGTIYIEEDTWRIYSVDLLITKEQQMEFVDTFRIKQNFIRINNETWMPFSHQFDYSFNAFGFKGNGIVLGVFSNYNLSPDLSSITFNGEVMIVDVSANKKDTTYWNSVRPVPLSNIESVDYQRRDSARVIRESKTYLDSIDNKSNKFSSSSLLSSYTWNNSFKHISFEIISPVRKISFNTVEGWNTALEGSFNNNFGKEDRRDYSISPTIRYGFSNSHFNGHINFKYKYNTQKLSTLEIDGGTDLVQINNTKPISEVVNGLYSLLAEKNYLKAYEKQFIYLSHKSELFNGVFLKIGGEYSHRTSITNSTDFKVVNSKDRNYTSNDPYNPSTDEKRFPSNKSLSIETNLSIRPGQEFINRPEGKYILGSRLPVFRLTYKKGLNFLGSVVDYDMIQFGLDDELMLGIFGHLKYKIVYGDFLSFKNLFLPDIKHFSANKTWFSDFRMDDYKNLDYYSNSTVGAFIEAHVEENFGGFVLNKIPFIRKLKLQEIAGFHYLHTDKLDQYIELSIGVEKLGLLRAELYTSLINGRKGTIGFLLGIKKTFGNL